MTICIIAIAVCIIFLHVIERMCGKSLVEINTVYNIPDSDIWKRELDSAEKGKEKN
jgi:hypothetical protein